MSPDERAARDFAERGLFAGVQTSVRRAAAADADRLFTLTEAQAFCLQRWGLRVSIATLRRYVRKGALVVVRYGEGPKRRVRVRGAVLTRFFSSEISHY